MTVIYYLGPKGSYTNVATEKTVRFLKIENPEYKAFSNIQEGFSSILKADEGYLVVPIENMIRGTVRETLDSLLTINNDELKIIAETTIGIEHCIISKGNDIKKIRHIISNPQAISQCYQFIYKTFGNDVIITNTNSTSLAVASLDNYDDTYAAISNELCAKLYNRNVLLKNISDVPDNKTRFVILSKQNIEKKLKYKTSISFSTPNEFGALANILNIFAKHSINLLHIDSRPSKLKFGDYLFYCELDGGLNDKNLFQSIFEIQKHVDFYHLNGSYFVF